MYRTFTRTWWKENPDWPSGLEPCPGDKSPVSRNLTEGEARNQCQTYNRTHNPGRLSRKMEYEQG